MRLRITQAAVRLFGLVVHLAPLGLERPWRRRMVEDFADRAHSGRYGPVELAFLLARALVDLAVESGRRRLGGGRETRGRDRRSSRGGWSPMDVMWQDVRYALRGVRKSPGFAVVVIVTLTLAIGANTTLFSVVNGVLLRPLPYPDSESLYQLTVHFRDGSRDPSSSYPDFVDQRAELEPVATLAAWHFWRPTLTAEGAEPRRLRGIVVSADWFEVLGLEPSRGRFFNEEEIRSGDASEIVVSHALWRTTFGEDPGIVGRTVALNGRPRTVIGVGPAEFPSELPGIGQVDLWVPLEWEGATEDELPGRSSHNLLTVVRLRDGVDHERAEGMLDLLMARLEEQYPDHNQGKGVDLESMHRLVVGDAAVALKVLLGGVVVVLLIAVANVTSVLLGRAADREREMALRSALGADRSRLYAQLIVESVVLALVGGASGVALAYWGTGVLVDWGASAIPLARGVAVDGTVLAVSATIALGSGVLMGLAPAWSSARVHPHRALREGAGGRGTSGRRKLEIRGALVVAQVAMSLSLLVGAGLLVRSLAKLSEVDTGVDDSVLTFGLHLPDARYQEASDREAFHAELEELLERIPGLREVAVINGIPLSGLAICGSLYAEEDPDRFAGGDTCAQVRAVSGDYFEVMDIPLLEGRTLNELDHAESTDVIVINEAVAELLWPGESPLGKRIMTGFRGTFHEVVGVVGNTKQFRLDEPLTYQTYISHLQWRRSALNVVVSHESDLDVLMPSIREAVWSLDPLLPLYGISTIGDLRDATLVDHRFRTTLIAAMSALALILAVIGIYGVISYSVSQRQREMAIRMSMGARAQQVVRMVLRQGMKLVALGLVLGAIGSVIFARALRSLLYEVETSDPLTLSTVTLSLVAAALLAAYGPARRATRVDPMTVLREE